MIAQILQLRSRSLSIPEIAEECGLTVGQVKYQLRKFKSQSTETDLIGEGVADWQEEAEVDFETVGGMDEFDDAQEGEQTLAIPTNTGASEWSLPDFYSENVVKLLPQSPTILYAYWEITWTRMRMVASYLQTDFSYIQKGLRLYDTTDRYFDGANAHQYRDIIVHDEARSWFVKDVEPGRTYIADFGLFHNGHFCPILRSKPITTPRNRPAMWGEPLIAPVPHPDYPAWLENFSTYSVYSK